jgi:MYXO-CTERM domain-containing protein
MLNAQGLAQCTPDFCLVEHPLVVAMLRDFLPAPEDVNANDYYGCISCYVDVADFSQWDPVAFAAQLDERVIDPARHARDLLAAWPYLTRMYTTISPHEMTVDPMFHQNAELTDAPLANVATQQCVCDEDAVVSLPDGRLVYAPLADFPSFGDDMPYAEHIETIPPVGAPIVDVDNTALIDELLAAHNAQYECMPSGSGSGSGSDGGADSSDLTAGTSPNDTSGSGESGGSGDQDLLEPQGCGCRTDDDEPGEVLVAVGLLAYLRRRRRAASTNTTANSADAPGPRSSVLQPQPNRSRSRSS